MTIHHEITSNDQTAMAAMRQAVAGAKGNIGPEARPFFDEIMGHTPPAPGISYEEDQIGGVPGWWCRPETSTAHQVVLYFHGGAYQLGSAKAYRNFVGQIAAAASIPIFIPDYRLAPENPFPAAVNDAQAAYRGLLDLGFTEIILAGDSAGGGLALALFAVVSKTGISSKGAAVMSPWTDLALEGETLQTKAEIDPLLTKLALEQAAENYLSQQDRRHPLASPLYGDLDGLPPVLIHVGEDEILLSDSQRFTAKILEVDGHCELHIWEGMPHVFPASIGVLESAPLALESIGQFIKNHLQGA